MRSLTGAAVMVLAFTPMASAQIDANRTQNLDVYISLIEHISDVMESEDASNRQRFPDFRPQDRTFVLEVARLPSLTRPEVGLVVERLRNAGVRVESCTDACEPSPGDVAVAVIEHDFGSQRASVKAIVSGSFDNGDAWKNRISFELSRGPNGWVVDSEILEWEGLYRP